jgi:hypothetical protein
VSGRSGTLLSLPVARLTVDTRSSADESAGYVYEHLRFYCSLIETLPAVVVTVDESAMVTVSQRRVYARIARDLGRPAIRAVVDPASDPAGVARLLREPGVERLSWAEIDAAERKERVAWMWQVFFFARPLTDREQRAFRDEVVGVFAKVPDLFPEAADLGAAGPLSAGEEGALLYFRAVQPTGDQAWMRDYVAAIRRFSAQEVRIVSFQGRKLAAQDA